MLSPGIGRSRGVGVKGLNSRAVASRDLRSARSSRRRKRRAAVPGEHQTTLSRAATAGAGILDTP
jgi:hypothetical protein